MSRRDVMMSTKDRAVLDLVTEELYVMIPS